MNASAPFSVGSRVLVQWNDGRAYPGVVGAFHNGYVQVRWDTGGAPQWVPIAHVRAAVAPVAHAAPAAPPPQAWGPPAVEKKPEPAPPPAAPAASAAPASPPPKPMTEKVADLPRGLVYEPTAQGPGTGRAFFFFFGFVSTSDGDLSMRMTDIDHIGDDVAALRAAGYRVVLDLHGDAASLDLALRGEHPEGGGAQPVGVFWSSHGFEDGSIEDHVGRRVNPEQISEVVAQRGTVKLFVMSACFAGKHSGRWQQRLGPNAQVIGWGAPITNERAVEFLTPDEKSSKGFDDLLERHLGVRRVTADGPLTELKELALAHEDKLGVLKLSFQDLVKIAASRQGCEVKPGKGREVYLVITTPASKPGRPPRSQGVRLAPTGVGDELIHIGSVVGPYSDAIDIVRGIREVSDAIRTRLAILKLSPGEPEFIVAETFLRRRGLDGITFSRTIGQVAAVADKLEDIFFGSDMR